MSDLTAPPASATPRARLSALLRTDTCLVTPHEHIGSELIQHGPADRHVYQQSVRELTDRLIALRNRVLGGRGRVAALALPMPYYRYFKPEGTPLDPITVVRGIRRRNHEVLDACAEHRAADPAGEAVPLAALLCDPFRGAERFAAEYADRRDEVFALKWHPAAHLRSPEAHVRLGYLDLAAEWDIPVVVHCAPRGRMGDLADLRTHVLPRAQAAGVRVCVAHAGYLDPALPAVLRAPGVFADLGPWEALRERALGGPAPAGATDRHLARLLSASAGRLMFSLDSPWHLEHREGGRVLGADAHRSLVHFLATITELGLSQGALLHENALALLFGPDSRPAGPHLAEVPAP
ncbi:MULTISPECIES: hypothetical protein [unclassified Streptomyces]|uniref:hypothetical protein n=1 Tax=unclassified Streptomyces TaxID=2593676 RepID=UPI00381B1CC2